MIYDLVIYNAHIINPADNMDQMGAVLIKQHKIMSVTSDMNVVPEIESVQKINAHGCYLFPGLIDFHVHAARGINMLGLSPDAAMLPNGVTSIVDQGSVGASAFPAFFRSVICQSDLSVRSFLHVNPDGLAHHPLQENTDPRYYDIDAIQNMLDLYRQVICGLKVRIGGLVTDRGYEPLAAAKSIARQFQLPLCAHIVRPDHPYSELLPILSQGDIVAHCFQPGPQYTIFSQNGQILPDVLDARKRGVLFDLAAGRANHSLNICRQAALNGFFPDILSTDLVTHSIYSPTLFSLPRILSIFLQLGMPLMDLVRACTHTPAKAMNPGSQLGTLTPGSRADIAIFKLENIDTIMRDEYGDFLPLSQLFIPQMTVLNGQIVYRQITFADWV